MGRRSGQTPQRIEAITNALRAGNTRRAAAAFAEVGERTLYRWIRESGAFRQAVEKAEADAEVRFSAQIVQAATNGSWQAAAWWLERRRSADYGRHDRTDVTVEVRRLVDSAARKAGLDPREVFAEVESILGEGP